MADHSAFLNEFTRFLSGLPHVYKQLWLNQFTQALETVDNMISASERICILCAIFLFFAKRRSGRKPGARVTNFVLGELKVIARGS